MAADWLSRLPSAWTYGVRRDGRIFFINEQTQSTTWLHPESGEAVVTGHRKTADLPTGWEEGYTFEGARCFINHNERKVTCKHPLTGAPSQDNCIFVVNEQPAPTLPSSQNPERRDRPSSLLSESQTGAGSDHSPTTSLSTATSPCPGPNAAPGPPRNSSTAAARPSRSSKKIHNFGKRSNSIKRNANAPVVKRGWLYKQDSTGMKLWKKRWFVLCDMCLFYYRDEKEDNVLGSILLPSFHISMLSVDDHISRKYAFKATHSNMRTYYFCTDSAKDSESWMEVLTDAAMVHTEPHPRTADHLIDQVNANVKRSEELNNQHNQRALTCPEIQNNQRNRENRPDRQRHRDNHADRQPDCYTLHRDGDSLVVKKDGVSYTLQKHGDKYVLHKDGEMFLLRRNGERFSLIKDEPCAVHNSSALKGEPCAVHNNSTLKDEPCNIHNNNALNNESCALHNNSTLKKKHISAEDAYSHSQVQDGSKLLSVKETPPYATHTLPAQPSEGQRYFPVKEVRRQLSLRETDRSSMFGNNKYGTIHVVDRYGTLKEVKKYATLREGDRYATSRDMDVYGHRDTSADRAKNFQLPVSHHHQNIQQNISQSLQNTSESNEGVDQCDGSSRLLPVPPVETAPAPKTGLSRTHSMPPMELWARPYRAKPDADASSICSYQTLPRNMPSHRSQMGPRYPEGYRTLPRNSLCRDAAGRADAVCAGNTVDKRRKDDTMWQLYEWQQRQAYSRLSMATPTGGAHYGTLPSSKTMSHLREHMATPLPPSPSHGSIYNTLPPPRPHSELSSPLPKDGSLTLGRQKPLPHKMGIAERISVAGVTPHDITPQSLQGKTIIPDPLKTLVGEGEEPDIDTKLSRLCEQDKVVRTQEEKVQQLHREKHTLETALLSASQELSEQNAHTAHTHSLLQQRDVLQGGLLSTCRELGRVTAELQLSRQEYQRLEGDVSQAKARLLQQLEALGSPQTEPPSQRHIQIQKELWRIQDVMEALAKTQIQSEGFPSSKPLSSISKNEGPDYRLYKSEPELTTVKEEESDEPHPPEERVGVATERREVPVTKVTPCPVGIVPPRTKNTLSPPESSTIACYVTLRKKKPEPRAERPHSALDPAGGFGDREPGRVRMSVEEQLERMRRNQEACTLRRTKLSRSASFNRDQSPASFKRDQSPASFTRDQSPASFNRDQTLGTGTQQQEPSEERSALKDEHGGSEVTKSDDMKECERQTAVILEVPQPQVKMVEVPEPQVQKVEVPQPQVKMVEVPEAQVKMVEVSAQPQMKIMEDPQPHMLKVMEVQPFEDLSSSANSPSDSSLQTPEPQWSPDQEESRDLNQDSSSEPQWSPDQEESPDLNKDSSPELHLLLPAQPMTLVSSDT